MGGTRHRVFWWVFGTHAAVLALMLIVPWLKGCSRPKIIPIDLTAIPPAPEQIVQPEPVKKEAPPPTNTPPRQVKKEPEPKEPEPKPEPKKPEWKPAEVKRQDRRVANPNTQPVPQQRQIDVSGIKSALQSAGGGSTSPFAGYYSSVYQHFYSVWQQPAGTPVGTTAAAVIRVERDGTVSYKSLDRPSGVAAFDQSVQAALNAVARLPAPPADLPSRDITVTFELSN